MIGGWKSATYDERLKMMRSFIHAASKGDLERLKKAIGTINQRDWDSCEREAICSAAARNGHLHVVKYLSRTPEGIPYKTWSGGDTDDPWCGSISVALKHGHFDIVKYLASTSRSSLEGVKRATGKRGPIRGEAKCGRLEGVKFLISMGANIGTGYVDAVEDAAGHGNLEIVELLVNSGVDLTATNRFGSMLGSESFKAAVLKGHVKVAKFLISSGISVDAKTSRILFGFDQILENKEELLAAVDMVIINKE